MATPKRSNVSKDLAELRVDTSSNPSTSIRKSLVWPRGMKLKIGGGRETKTSGKQWNAGIRENEKVELRGYKNGTVEVVHPLSKVKQPKSVRFENVPTKVRVSDTCKFTTSSCHVMLTMINTLLILSWIPKESQQASTRSKGSALFHLDCINTRKSLQLERRLQQGECCQQYYRYNRKR